MPKSTSERLARAVYGPQTQAAAMWAKQACELLVHGKIEHLVAAIAALPSLPREPGESRSLPEKAMDYFTSNAQRMRYPAFRAQGMHVGSGEASAACKTVVAPRLKRVFHALDPPGLGCSVASADLRSQPDLRRVLGRPTSSCCLTSHN